MSKAKARDWTPKDHPGGVYCSMNACGGRCLRADYEKVKAEAEQMARDLGDGWEVHVHENLGWFSEVRRGGIHVSCRMYLDAPDGIYRARYQAPPNGGILYDAVGATAREAVFNLIEIVVGSTDEEIRMLRQRRADAIGTKGALLITGDRRAP